MLSLALFTSNADTAFCIEQLAEESRQFSMVLKSSPALPTSEIFQTLKRLDPDVILLDLAEWNASELTQLSSSAVAGLVRYIHASDLRSILIGFLAAWSPSQQAGFAASGIADLLSQPFSSLDLEKAAYQALHRDHPVNNKNILAFLPAKAGGGCSVIALNTAAALASQLRQKVLLIEADRRSGVLAIMLNLTRHRGLAQALDNAAHMTAVAWQQYVEIAGMHILLSDPGCSGQQPGWADYYQLLHFVQRRYDFVIADLPEIVNEASAELVRCARGVFLVCTPEVPSLQMAVQRMAELELYGVARDRVHILLNRQERRGLPVPDIEKALGRTIFATLPNDYAHVRDAIVESRVVAKNSPFGESCLALARKMSGLPQSTGFDSAFGMLGKLRRRAG